MSRPRSFDGPAELVGALVPEAMATDIKRIAKARHAPVSEIVREALNEIVTRDLVDQLSKRARAA